MFVSLYKPAYVAQLPYYRQVNRSNALYVAAVVALHFVLVTALLYVTSHRADPRNEVQTIEVTVMPDVPEVLDAPVPEKAVKAAPLAPPPRVVTPPDTVVAKINDAAVKTPVVKKTPEPTAPKPNPVKEEIKPPEPRVDKVEPAVPEKKVPELPKPVPPAVVEEVKKVVLPEPKPEVKPEPKPVAKPEPKPEIHPEVKPVAPVATLAPVGADERNKEKNAAQVAAPSTSPATAGAESSGASANAARSGAQASFSSTSAADSHSNTSTAASPNGSGSPRPASSAGGSPTPAPALAGGGAPAANAGAAAGSGAGPATAEADWRSKELNNPLPIYPEMARRMRLKATVVVLAEVLLNGSAGDVRISVTSGSELLDKVSVETVKKWRFTPAKKDGVPYVQLLRISFNFGP